MFNLKKYVLLLLITIIPLLSPMESNNAEFDMDEVIGTHSTYSKAVMNKKEQDRIKARFSDAHSRMELEVRKMDCYKTVSDLDLAQEYYVLDSGYEIVYDSFQAKDKGPAFFCKFEKIGEITEPQKALFLMFLSKDIRAIYKLGNSISLDYMRRKFCATASVNTLACFAANFRLKNSEKDQYISLVKKIIDIHTFYTFFYNKEPDYSDRARNNQVNQDKFLKRCELTFHYYQMFVKQSDESFEKYKKYFLNEVLLKEDLLRENILLTSSLKNNN